MKNIGGNQKCPLVYIKFKNRNESNKKHANTFVYITR